MPASKKYDEETMARAVRMYRDRVAEGGITKLGARREVGELLGVNQSTLRNWIRRGSGAAAAAAEDGRASSSRTRGCAVRTPGYAGRMRS